MKPITKQEKMNLEIDIIQKFNSRPKSETIESVENFCRSILKKIRAHKLTTELTKDTLLKNVIDSKEVNQSAKSYFSKDYVQVKDLAILDRSRWIYRKLPIEHFNELKRVKTHVNV